MGARKEEDGGTVSFSLEYEKVWPFRDASLNICVHFEMSCHAGYSDHPCLESTFQILTAMGFRIDSHTLW